MTRPPHVPTLEEFKEVSSEAFGFLKDYGFVPVEPPAHRAKGRFQEWFSNGIIHVVVRGEMHGTAASVHFETEEHRVSPIDLVPRAERPPPWKRGAPRLGQLGEIRAAAARIEQHCQDVLSGDMERFRAAAQPLPPYLRPDIQTD